MSSASARRSVAESNRGQMRTTTVMAVFLLAIAAVVMIGLLVIVNQFSQRSQALDEMENQRGYCETSISELMSASDYLTSEVRYYLLDGDTQHMQNFWNEVEQTQARDVALQKLMHSNLTVQETSHVLKAKSSSDSLITGETWAMRMVAESHGVSENDMPTRVKNYKLIASDEALSAQQKQVAVQNYLFGTTYESGKQEIRNAVQSFRDDLAIRLEAQTAASLAESQRAGIWAVVGIISLMAVMIVSIIVYFRMTGRKNRQLSDALKQATAASAAKSVFTSRMSHEIRTPLNAVTGFLTIADQEEDTQKKNENIEKAQVAAQNLLRIVNDVLDLSAIENGRVKLASESFSIKALLDNLELIYVSQAAGKGIDLKIRQSQMIHDAVCGDRMRENQILTNLLSNAIKFTSSGGTVELAVSQMPLDASQSESGGERVLTVFTVSDTGIGMDPEFLDNVFEPYEQADASISQKYGGTGLGLSIVKNMTEMMGGSVKVESEPGIGSVFTVAFPNKVANAEGAAAEGNGGKPLEQRWDADDKSLDGLKVLLAEDNMMNSEIARNILTRNGATVTAVFNGQEAVDAFRASMSGTFDIILMDIQMPELNGYQATEQIRHCDHVQATSIPIIAMTANAFDEDVQQALDAGMNAHIAKPLDIPSMIRMLHRYSPS